MGEKLCRVGHYIWLYNIKNKLLIMNVKPTNTDEKIISATLKLLRQEGAEKATTKKIAAEAGVNEVTIFRNFENKKNLIETTKEFYLKKLINTLEEIFDYGEDEEIEEYLRITFFGILNLSDEEFSIIKVAMEEAKEVSEKKLLIAEITDVMLNKLQEFFQLKIDEGKIRDVDTKSLSVMCFGVLFQSVILWKIYDKSLGFETNNYIDDILNILEDGIKI
jgi:AcrR family transcriptional regulator